MTAARKKRDGRRNNPGPPKTVGGEVPAVVVSLRVPGQLRDDVEAAAHQAGLSPSEWWRLAALAALGPSRQLRRAGRPVTD